MWPAEDVVDKAQKSQSDGAGIQLPIASRRQLDNRIEDQSRSQSVGNIVGEQHHRDRRKRWYHFGQIREVDPCYRAEHEHPDRD